MSQAATPPETAAGSSPTDGDTPGRSTDDTDALVAVICDLSLAHSLADITAICTRASRQLLHADGSAFVLRDHNQCHYVDEDAVAPLWKGRRLAMDSCIGGWVMRHGEAAVIPDVARDARIPAGAYRDTFVRSLAMVPASREEPVAALGAYWAARHEPPPGRLAMLQTIANAAALALAKLDLERQRANARHAQMELDHRLKNVLAVIHAIAHQTVRRAANLDEFAQSFTGRLQALATAQTLVSRAGSGGAEVRALLREQLLEGGDDPRVTLDGPEVHLPADEAYHCGLAIHELGTNARKYGALSRDDGRLAVTWTVRHDDGQRKLVLEWKERGGPTVEAPAHRGFGTTLLSHAFSSGGGVETRYDPEGVVCTITIDLGTSPP